MFIWVDADACPKVIKEILFRAANRTKTNIILVANRPLYIPPSLFIKIMLVSAGFDKADDQIIKLMQEGDLVITADILLANEVVTHGGTALNPRGELYSTHNIKRHVAIRNFNEGLRNSGMITGGPLKLSQQEIQTFANCLDQFLTKTRPG